MSAHGSAAIRFASAALALGATLLQDRMALAASPKLVVFLHVSVKQRALQSLMEAGLPGTAVTAVGRIADFERALKEGQDAVLTLPVVLQAHGLPPKLQGRRRGASEESYSLVSVDAAADPARIKSVGALDLLGREGTIGFVRGLLESQPKVERVTKVEDLLALLQMQRVEGILLPSRLFPELKSVSRLNLIPRELPKKVGLPAVAVVGAGGAQVMNAISRLPAETTEFLGVNEWR